MLVDVALVSGAGCELAESHRTRLPQVTFSISSPGEGEICAERTINYKID